MLKVSDAEAADAIRVFVDNDYWTTREVIEELHKDGYEIVKKEPTDEE